MDILKLNKIQTPIGEDLKSKLKQESYNEMIECIDKIVLVGNMINANRRKAKDMPTRKDGRIIIDFENPHILEDMDFFRERAIFFQKHGVYTHIFQNETPGSEYRRFWDEEKRRCTYGMVRPSDGEWISGYYYHYLNYTKIELVKTIEGNRAERVSDFPDVWDGDYLFFHYIEQAEELGKHAAVLKCRGRGYSFKAGSMANRNYFHIRKSKSFLFASETEFLIKDGVMNKAIDNMNYIDNNTPFTQPRDYKDTELYKRASYKDPELKTEKGLLSEIIGVTCKDDPDKGRGKRGKLLVFDESGLFPGLLHTWAVARKSVEQGKAVYGCMCSMGTGGTKGADFEAAEELFYHPSGYNVLSLRNVYDKCNGVGECSFFIPEYLNRTGCYDRNGNSDIIKALIEIFEQRDIVRSGTTDPNAIIKEKAESPIVPLDAVLKTEGSIFPVSDIKDYLAEIIPNYNKFIAPHYIGRLSLNNGDVRWLLDETIQPIRDFPLKDNSNKIGCLEIYSHPVNDSSGKPTWLRYIGGIDPYDDDTGTSLGSIFILDRWTDKIVAEYTGRPMTANDFYEICLKLIMYYNALTNYESNKKGLFGYFSNKHVLHYLCDTPKILIDKQMVKTENLFGNKSKGTNATTAVNMWARRLQADYLNESIRDNDDLLMPRLRSIRSVGYLRELSMWHPDLNCDRISAMGMLMILREDLFNVEINSTFQSINSLANDKFWDRMYKGKPKSWV